MTREDVVRLVRALAVEIDDAERHRLKGVLQATVEQITLDPANLHCRIHYRIATDRTLDMAKASVSVRPLGEYRSPFAEFVRLPAVVFLAWLMFGEIVDHWTSTGTAVIFAATMYITHREARNRSAKTVLPVC